jgi:hypothetical protein
MAYQVWEYQEFDPPNGAEQAVQFLNDPDRQGPGEVASATLRNNGTVGLIYLAPGSLGTSTSQTWILKQLPGPSPDGENLAVQLLNAADQQGPGEASATLRDDGSVGLIFLAPGSLGTPNPDTGNSQTWYWQEFEPEPNVDVTGAQLAVQFLNEADRQGPGQVASLTARGNGSAGLLFLGPGSLGTSTSPTWTAAEFNSAQDAVAFLNGTHDPLQKSGPGEAVGFMPGDSVVIFYLANPTGIIHP